MNRDKKRIERNRRAYNKLKERVAICEKDIRHGKRPRVKKQKKTKLKTYTDYYVYIKSPTWFALRARALKRDNGLCVHCKKPAVWVHHTKYSFPYGTEKIRQLQSVCVVCHKIIHHEFDEISMRELINK